MWVGWRRRRSDRSGKADAPVGDAATPTATPKPAPVAAPKETPPQKAARTVQQGEAIIERQRELVFHLRRHGLPTDDAEKVLRTFQETLFEHRKYLALLQNRERRGLLDETPG
jgi:hypothetical protein